MPTLSLNNSKKTKHTPAGEIPVDWGWAELSQIVHPEKPIVYGIVQAGPHVEGGIPYIRSTDVGGRIDTSALLRTSSEIAAKYKRSVVGPGDIVFSLRGNIGEVSVVPDSLSCANLTQGTARISVSTSHSRHYIHQALVAPSISRRILTVAKGSTFREITLEDLRSLAIPVPPLPEQIRIAAILSTWDRAIETLESLIAAKDRRKQALMQQLLTGRKRLPGFEGKWAPIRMNKLLERVFRPIDWDEDLPLVLISIRRRFGGLFRRPEVKGSEYKTQDLHEVRENDFLISKRQVVHGAWALVPSEFEGGHVSKEYAILDNIAPGLLHMPFFGWLSQTGRMVRLARVSSTGVHIEKLIFDPKVFLRESISLPPSLEEQRAIAAVLNTADRELALHRQHLEALRTQKRGLMGKLLTGEVRVPSPESYCPLEPTT